MIDLVHLFSKLVDQKGRILIPGVNDLVKAMTAEEDKLYDNIDFDTDEYASDIGCERLLHDGENVDKLTLKKLTLQHRWRYPSLSIHGKDRTVLYLFFGSPLHYESQHNSSWYHHEN